MPTSPSSSGVQAKTGATAALRLPGKQLTIVVPSGMEAHERVILRSEDEAATYRRALAPSDGRPSPEHEDGVALVFDGLSPDLSYTLVLDHDGREDDNAGDEVVFKNVPFAELKRLERGEEVGETWLSEDAEPSSADAKSLENAQAEDEHFSEDLWNALLKEEGLIGPDP